ncbi:MAG: DUF2341 domain-containing protein [Candidatus Hodarchaeota archaeon]
MTTRNKTIFNRIILFILFFKILFLLNPINEKDGWNESFYLDGLSSSSNSNFLPSLINNTQSYPESANSLPIGIQSSIQSKYSVGRWVDTRWKYRKNITVSASKINTYMTDFPLLIDLKDTDLRNDVQADAGDIFFTDSNGNKLDHEIEFYNRYYSQTQSQLVAWVKTNLSNITNTLIHMYFGNPTSGNQENPEGVWDDNYMVVNHLNEDPNGVIYDSTKWSHDGSTIGDMSLSNFINGKIGKAFSFVATSQQAVNIPDHNDFDIDTEFTIESWVNFPLTVLVGSEWHILSHHSHSDNAGYLFRMKNGLLEGRNYWSSGCSTINLNPGITADTWHQVVFRFNRYGTPKVELFVDGSSIGNDSSISWDKDISHSVSLPLRIGGPAAGGFSYWFDGSLDEIRISNSERSNDWIQLQYINQLNPSSFYSVTSKETSPVTVNWPFPLYRYRKSISINPANVSGNNYLVNFPLMVELYDKDLHDSTKVQADGDDIIFASEEYWVWSDELVQNVGFETGNLAGWSSSGNWAVGNNPPSGGPGPQSGSYNAYISNGGTATDYIQQEISVSEYSSFIDAGEAIANLSGWLVAAETPGHDASQIRFEYLDTDKTVLSTPLDSGLQEPTTWIQYCLNYSPIPIGTRYIRVWARTYEDGWDSGSVDSFSIKIGTLQKSSSGIRLNHEIELFDQNGNGTHAHLIAWVSIPAVSGNVNANFTMYYGNNVIRNQEKPTSIWENYEGVWHLAESSGSGSYIKDSTGLDRDGTPYNTLYLTSGKIDSARNFTGVSGSQIEADNSSSIFSGYRTFSFSFWVYPNYATDAEWNNAGEERIFHKNYVLGLSRWWYTGSGMGKLQTDIKWADGTTSYFSVYNIHRQEWNLISYSYDGQVLKGYVNGELSSSQTKVDARLASDSNPFYMGSTANTFSGYMDEFRISQTFRSENWIKTEYNNQNNTKNFLVLDNEEENPRWWADATFTYRKDIRIDHSQINASGDYLTDFPVLISLTDSDLRSGRVQPSAQDILFMSSNGTILDFEIESFDQNIAQGQLISWVRIPTLSKLEDSIISMYYGSSDLQNNLMNIPGVWKNSYSGVWHLNNNPSGNIVDSTYNVMGTSYGNMNSTSQVTGVFGEPQGALNFDGSDDYIAISNLGTLGLSIVTLSLWIYPNELGDAGILNRQSLGANDGLIFSTGWNGMKFRLNMGGTQYHLSMSTLWPPLNTWTHVVCTYNGTTMIMYINGIQDSSLDATGSIEIDDWFLGWRGSSTYFNGTIDDPRISHVTRSSEWIRTEYNNQFNPTSFYYVGSEIIFDNIAPIINSFGVDDPGTGIGIFWAKITDTTSDIASAIVKVNDTEHSMSNNGTHWIFQLPVMYKGYYTYQITNTTDCLGNFITQNSSIKNHTFSLDKSTPDVIQSKFITSLNSFKANVTDSWGEIHTVIVNVTTHSLTIVMVNYQNFSGNILGYVNNTLTMPNGDINFRIFVNDTSGNSFLSDPYPGVVFINHAPNITNIIINSIPYYSNISLVLDYQYYDEDSHQENGTEIRWFQDNGTGIFQLITSYNDQLQIPEYEIIRGHKWYCTVKPKDGDLFGNLINSSDLLGVITIINTPPKVVIREDNHPEFIIEDQDFTISNSHYTFTDADNDIDQSTISWFKNNILQPDFQNLKTIPSSATHAGDQWYYVISPYDSFDSGFDQQSPIIVIESRSMFNGFKAIPVNDTEGHYFLELNVTDSRNDIKFIYWNATYFQDRNLVTAPKTGTNNIWLLDYQLINQSYLNLPVYVEFEVQIELTDYSRIYTLEFLFGFNFTTMDTVAPRVTEAYFSFDDDLNPQEITFYAEINEYGSGISEVILYYYYRADSAGGGATLFQDEYWLSARMSFELINTSESINLYSVSVLFEHNNSNTEIIYRIYTLDNDGNENPSAFDIRNYPQRIKDQKFIYQAPGLPEWLLLLAGSVVVLIFAGSIVYIKFIRKPEIVGLDKELVIEKISEIDEQEVLNSIELHTLGVVTSFFDQRHGPIPIIIIPEILRDNFTKLIELSDRSFNACGFCDDFTSEIQTSYDFILSEGLRISVLSFSFALERPDARGGQENITINILIHKDMFPLIDSFKEEIQKYVHEIHVLMNQKDVDKQLIQQKVTDLRKSTSSIILSYEEIYGTTKLLTEDDEFIIN